MKQYMVQRKQYLRLTLITIQATEEGNQKKMGAWAGGYRITVIRLNILVIKERIVSSRNAKNQALCTMILYNVSLMGALIKYTHPPATFMYIIWACLLVFPVFFFF
mgnify:CR=1 FL=1